MRRGRWIIAMVVAGCSSGGGGNGPNSLSGELAFPVVESGFTATTGDPWSVGIYLADRDLSSLCGQSICPPQTFRRSVSVILVGDASLPLAPGTFVVGAPTINQIQVWNFEPGGISARSQSGSIVIESYDGTSIKGSFDAVIAVGDTTSALSGRFDAVTCCLP